MLKDGLKKILSELIKNQKDETHKVKLNYEKAFIIKEGSIVLSII